jgi:hypothetical protein
MLSAAQRFVIEGLLLVCGPVFLASLGFAQRPVMPVPHPQPVAPVHVQAPPPVYRAPIIQPPIMRSPILYAPRLSSPRPVTVPMTAGIGMPIIHPPIRPFPPRPPVIFVYNPIYLYGGPIWTNNLCWWATCNTFWPWTFGIATISSPGPTTYVQQVYETPVYVYGDEREELPQLYLINGMVLNVNDYWVVDNQLHFTIADTPGAKPVEHSIDFGELDLQKTVDANTSRGFRFLLRNEPFEQYVRDHPEGPPPVANFPPQ